MSKLKQHLNKHLRDEIDKGSREMENEKERILKGLANCIINGDEDGCERNAREAQMLKLDAYEMIMDGCAKGMKVVGEKYQKKEFFLPDLLVSAAAMYRAINLLKSNLKVTSRPQGTVIIGTCRGDVHDIGKNLVVMFLEAEGFSVHDLGVDVPVEQFKEKAGSLDADFVGISTLMTTTLPLMKRTVELVKQNTRKDQVKVIIGGAATSKEMAEKIGVDFWAKDAIEGISIMKSRIQRAEKA